MGRWTTARRPPTIESAAWIRRAPDRLREPVADDLARRGDPARRQPRASTASSISRTSRRASWPSTTTTGSCSSVSTATRSTPTPGRSRRAACPTARTALDGARARAARGDRRRGGRVAGARPRPPLELASPTRSRSCILATGLTHGDVGARARPRRSTIRWVPFEEVARDDPRRPHHRRDDASSPSSASPCVERRGDRSVGLDPERRQLEVADVPGEDASPPGGMRPAAISASGRPSVRPPALASARHDPGQVARLTARLRRTPVRCSKSIRRWVRPDAGSPSETSQTTIVARRPVRRPPRPAAPNRSRAAGIAPEVVDDERRVEDQVHRCPPGPGSVCSSAASRTQSTTSSEVDQRGGPRPDGPEPSRLTAFLRRVAPDLSREGFGDVAAATARAGDLVDRLDQLLGQHQVRAHIHAHTIAHGRAHSPGDRDGRARAGLPPPYHRAHDRRPPRLGR